MAVKKRPPRRSVAGLRKALSLPPLEAIPMRLLKPLGWITVSALMLLSACQNKQIDNTMPVEPEQPVSFSQDVQPVLTASCGGGSCHLSGRTSGVQLSTYRQVTSSIGVQYDEEVVNPGDAEGSPLIDKIEPAPRFGVRMPQGRAPLSRREIALIRTWVDEGAQNN